MPEIRKNFNLNVVMIFFWKCLDKFRHNSQIFKSRVSVSNFKSRGSISFFLMKSRSHGFNQVSVSKFKSQTTSMPILDGHWASAFATVTRNQS